MIIDALSGELKKLIHDKKLLFGSFLMIVLGYVLIDLIFFRIIVAGTYVHVDILKSLFSSLAIGQNLFAELFFISGAASIFAGEYRWETWNYLIPRNTRSALIAGKFLTFVIVVFAIILSIGVSDISLGMFEALVWHHELPEFSDLPTNLPYLFVVFLASLLKITVWGALSAFIAVMTRSVVATMMVTSLIVILEEILAEKLSGGAAIYTALFILPRKSAEAMFQWSIRSTALPASNTQALLAAVILSSMAIMLIWSAVMLFQKQDLSQE